ncbi:MAG: putative integral rane protein [Chitinophagaceae bacterium]|nr:putative integral rane protein [Chitinophagaceae bacterium]
MPEPNPNARLEAFCDGVFAIALTLLIIDIKIPSSAEINNAADLWQALLHITPSILAFVLSFIIILITWVNHHASLKLGVRSSPSFIYANGLLLLTVVFLPFPTAMMGEYILTNHAAPAVVLYNATVAFQAVGWIMIGKTALKDKLYKNEEAALVVHKNIKYGYFAFILYSLFALIAFWFPFTIAIITILTWIFWLIWGINMKHE